MKTDLGKRKKKFKIMKGKFLVTQTESKEGISQMVEEIKLPKIDWPDMKYSSGRISMKPTPKLGKWEDIRVEIIGAVARGWCSKKNEKKVMDSDLALAIAKEVSILVKAQIALAKQQGYAEAVEEMVGEYPNWGRGKIDKWIHERAISLKAESEIEQVMRNEYQRGYRNANSKNLSKK